MEFNIPGAQLFIPDETPEDEALQRVTHLGIAGHPDDQEIMSYAGAIECFQDDDNWFGGVILTNGSGAPREDLYGDYTDEMMVEVRAQEQKKAAMIGEYSFQVLFNYESSAVKDAENSDPTDELTELLDRVRPDYVYTHNPADKHSTHVGVVVTAIEACRRVDEDARPEKILGCEVWRDLDWMLDEDKIILDCSTHENLQAALLGVFDSQICGGKRYDLATMGRRRANATYMETHGVDVYEMANFAMDLTPLIEDPEATLAGRVKHYMDRTYENITDRIEDVGAV